MVKCVIAGPRYKTGTKIEFDDYEFVSKAVRDSGYGITEIVSGMARGVDSLGVKYSENANLPLAEFPIERQDWTKYGMGAGPKRNSDMADYADVAVIVWDGVSNGTKNMISQMKKRKKPYHLVMIGEDKASLEGMFGV